MRTSAHCAILRVKSPPHLEPRDIQRFLEHSFAAKRRENASAPQNGISSQTQQGIPPQGFQNHIPARGRKPIENSSATPIRKTFQNHIPARGRKPANDDAMFIANSLISKPYPRKGTETPSITPENDSAPKFQNHIPARGRKPPTPTILPSRKY